VNLMTFQAWGLIYAILQVLMSAVNLSSIDAVLNANGVLNSFVGSSQMILLALTASIFSFSIILIPFIASRIVRGDVGSTMMTLVSAMTTTASAVAGMTAASFAGVGEGAAAGVAGGASPAPPPPSASVPVVASLRDQASGSAGANGSSGASPSVASTSRSPAPPPGGAGSAAADNGSGSGGSSGSASSASPMRPPSRPGQHRGFNAPHAVAWYAGYSLGSAYRGFKGGE
jgi:hypothetical protein